MGQSRHGVTRSRLLAFIKRLAAGWRYVRNPGGTTRRARLSRADPAVIKRERTEQLRREVTERMLVEAVERGLAE